MFAHEDANVNKDKEARFTPRGSVGLSSNLDGGIFARRKRKQSNKKVLANQLFFPNMVTYAHKNVSVDINFVTVCLRRTELDHFKYRERSGSKMYYYIMKKPQELTLFVFLRVAKLDF